jgi:hypothetical protein
MIVDVGPRLIGLVVIADARSRKKEFPSVLLNPVTALVICRDCMTDHIVFAQPTTVRCREPFFSQDQDPVRTLDRPSFEGASHESSSSQLHRETPGAVGE